MTSSVESKPELAAAIHRLRVFVAGWPLAVDVDAVCELLMAWDRRHLLTKEWRSAAERIARARSTLPAGCPGQRLADLQSDDVALLLSAHDALVALGLPGGDAGWGVVGASIRSAVEAEFRVVAGGVGTGWGSREEERFAVHVADVVVEELASRPKSTCDEDMRSEYDFCGARRGAFYRPDVTATLPPVSVKDMDRLVSFVGACSVVTDLPAPEMPPLWTSQMRGFAERMRDELVQLRAAAAPERSRADAGPARRGEWRREGLLVQWEEVLKGSAPAPGQAFPVEVDLEGRHDRRDRGIRYLGKALLQPSTGEYIVLADVHGSLCRVAVRLTFDDAGDLDEAGSAPLGGVIDAGRDEWGRSSPSGLDGVGTGAVEPSTPSRRRVLAAYVESCRIVGRAEGGARYLAIADAIESAIDCTARGALVSGDGRLLLEEVVARDDVSVDVRSAVSSLLSTIGDTLVLTWRGLRAFLEDAEANAPDADRAFDHPVMLEIRIDGRMLSGDLREVEIGAGLEGRVSLILRGDGAPSSADAATPAASTLPKIAGLPSDALEVLEKIASGRLPVHPFRASCVQLALGALRTGLKLSEVQQAALIGMSSWSHGLAAVGQAVSALLALLDLPAGSADARPAPGDLWGAMASPSDRFLAQHGSPWVQAAVDAALARSRISLGGDVVRGIAEELWRTVPVDRVLSESVMAMDARVALAIEGGDDDARGLEDCGEFLGPTVVLAVLRALFDVPVELPDVLSPPVPPVASSTKEG